MLRCPKHEVCTQAEDRLKCCLGPNRSERSLNTPDNYKLSKVWYDWEPHPYNGVLEGDGIKLGDNRLHNINIEPHHINDGMYQRYERV